MPNVVSLDQLLISLNATLAEFAAIGLELRLFKNNFTPVYGSVIANFTEADFSGYAPVVIGPWNAAGLNVDTAFSDAVGNPFVFTNSTGAVGNDIYGFFAVEPGPGKVRFSARAATAPIDMQTAGKTLQVVLEYTDKNQ